MNKASLLEQIFADAPHNIKSAERSSEFRLTAPFAADKPRCEDGLVISTEKLGLNLSWNPFNKGWRRLRGKFRVNEIISGKKLWFISGSAKDGNWGALYQCSLSVVVGDEGVMFADSFWLPKFMVSYLLIPWQAMSSQRLDAEAFEFVIDGVEVILNGKKVAEAVRIYCPSYKQPQ